ncbi:MAG TPA: carbon storage regulator [Planctomycetaceae bacterium]|nr:carbon storage regulator [Planctomycetaceae bacterium]
MLVLTRKRGEAIEIDGRIEVRVLSIQGNRVRLGIVAPESVNVRRGELVFDIELPDHAVDEPVLACV